MFKLTHERELFDYKKKYEDQLDMLRKNIDQLQKEIVNLKNTKNELDRKIAEDKAIMYKTMDLDYKDKLAKELEKQKSYYERKIEDLKNKRESDIEEMRKDNFDKLKESLQKLHEEGNSQTKYLENVSLKMMDVVANQNRDLRIEEK